MSSPSAYRARPWEEAWTDDARRFGLAAPTVADAWVQQLPARGERTWIHYFDTAVSFARADEDASRLAAGLATLGIGAGDRVALYLQNVPQYAVSLLALWRLGAIAVACSPMLKRKELTFQLQDADVAAIIALEDLYEAHAAELVAELGGIVAVTTSEWEYGGPDGPRPGRAADGVHDLGRLIAEHEPLPEAARRVNGAGDVAVLTYTSGTTGPPKAAMNTHGNLAHSSEVLRAWVALGDDDVILGIAPLFHVTGLVAHVTVSAWAGVPLVLASRFGGDRTCALIERHRCTFTVAAITAYIAILTAPSAPDHDLTSLKKAYSGGAPVPVSVAAQWEATTGGLIHNIYGMTETTSPSHMVPLGVRAPVDPESGVMSVGLPVNGTEVRILDAEGNELDAGEVGEIATRGPQVVPGYWGRPEETAHAIRDGEMRTGDVGKMDTDGWFYVVDRIKDMINASGYKVWPREVEEVLYLHPAVKEAAVVGVPDEYRGETVKAYVTIAPGHGDVTADEIVAFARERLAAYKYPREVVLMNALPKTASGKILRRELRG